MKEFKLLKLFEENKFGTLVALHMLSTTYGKTIWVRGNEY